MSGSSLFGWYTSNHLCSIVESLLSLKGSLITCHALADNFGMLVDPDIWSCTEHSLDCSGKHFDLISCYKCWLASNIYKSYFQIHSHQSAHTHNQNKSFFMYFSNDKMAFSVSDVFMKMFFYFLNYLSLIKFLSIILCTFRLYSASLSEVLGFSEGSGMGWYDSIICFS